MPAVPRAPARRARGAVSGAGRRAVFLDRDGTLIEDPGYLAEERQVRLFRRDQNRSAVLRSRQVVAQPEEVVALAVDHRQPKNRQWQVSVIKIMLHVGERPVYQFLS